MALQGTPTQGGGVEDRRQRVRYQGTPTQGGGVEDRRRSVVYDLWERRLEEQQKKVEHTGLGYRSW